MIYQSVKFHFIAAVILSLFNLACDNANETVVPSKKQILNPTIDTIFAGERDTTVLLIDGVAFVKGHIIANKNQLKYALPVWKGQVVTAVLKPSIPGGNVRISQVQRPGDGFDGPFGDSIKYTLKGNGNLLIIIGENKMTGDPYTGDFILHITVK